MIIIGITGSIGMGKSTITNMLRYLKIPIHDSDEVVKALLDDNKTIISKIKEIWPSCICINVNKIKINKEALGQIIFNDKKQKKKLESIIHPYVINSRKQFIKKNKENNKKAVGLDVPLLYETKMDNVCDYIFLASASLINQKARVLKRPNMNIEKFNKICENQLTDLEKRKKKPIIISTNFGKTITFIIIIYNLILIRIRKLTK